MRYTTKRSGGPECEAGNVLCADTLAPCTSEMGQTRRFREVLGMPAYPPTPDMLPRRRERSKRAMNGLMRCNKTSALPLPPARQADVVFT